jgi:hypothetical protein
MSSEARTGWGGEFHLSADNSPANYVELEEVVKFGLPGDEADESEVTHLKSPGKRKEFIRAMLDGGTVDVEFNYVPGSATDVAIRNAQDAGNNRAIKFVIPDEAGDPEWKIETSAFVKGYPRGPIEANGKISATVRFRITGAQSEGAA